MVSEADARLTFWYRPDEIAVRMAILGVVRLSLSCSRTKLNCGCQLPEAKLISSWASSPVSSTR